MYLKALPIILVSILLLLVTVPSIPTSEEYGGGGGGGKKPDERVCGDRLCTEVDRDKEREKILQQIAATTRTIDPSPELKSKIPDWVKNNAKWWADGLIGNPDFLQGIQYLIEQGIMVIPETTPSAKSEEGIPEWIKNNAGWWSDGLIGEDDFVNGIKYLVENGIIRVDN